MNVLQLSTILFSTSVLVACGFDKISTYSQGQGGAIRSERDTENSGKDPGSENAIAGPQDPTQSETVVSRDPGFDTGLKECVKTGLIAQGKPVFIPKLIRATASLLSKETIKTNEEYFTLYDIILREIVTPSGGLVDYARLRDGGNLRSLWLRLREFFPSLSLDNMETDSQRIAFWVNLYNAIMIDILVDDPNALSFVGRLKTFSGVERNVGGFSITLDTIEYAILGLGQKTVPNPIPASADPQTVDRRLHVALVCGALSCPKLRNFAYEAASLETILEENAHMFFNDQEQHFYLDKDSGEYKVSSLFQWFSKDFDQFAGVSRPADLNRYFLQECRSDITEASQFLSSLGSFSELQRKNVLAYDWTPNEIK